MSPENERHHEERLLTQRLMIFLLWNSILFVGFATLSDFVLKLVVASVAFLAIPVQAINTERVRQTLSQLPETDRPREEHAKWKQPFAGRYIGFWFAGFFAIIWGFALVSTVGSC